MKGQSQYGGTRLFADCAAAAFARQGHQVDLFDLEETSTPGAAILNHATTAKVDLVFTINIAGEFRDSAGRTIRDLYAAPHVVWHTDYPLSQLARLRETPKSTALLFVDPTQIDGVKAVMGADRFDHLAFFPHPAVGEPAPDDATAAEFRDNRPIEVLWSGTFQQPGTPWAGVEGPARQVLSDALDLALSTEWTPPHVALGAVLTERGLGPDHPAYAGALESAILLDIEVRQVRRFEFLKAVAKSGVPVRICGGGWEKQLYRFKNATYEGPVEMTRAVELMRQSRLLLSTNGNFGAGSHERPFTGSLAGAAILSDFSRYYAQAFEPGRDIELFYWKDLPAGMETLKALVDDPARCFEQARAAKAKTIAGHTWDRQTALIFEAARAVGGTLP